MPATRSPLTFFLRGAIFCDVHVHAINLWGQKERKKTGADWREGSDEKVILQSQGSQQADLHFPLNLGRSMRRSLSDVLRWIYFFPCSATRQRRTYGMVESRKCPGEVSLLACLPSLQFIIIFQSPICIPLFRLHQDTQSDRWMRELLSQNYFVKLRHQIAIFIQNTHLWSAGS